jgi:hypothetical protein
MNSSQKYVPRRRLSGEMPFKVLYHAFKYSHALIVSSVRTFLSGVISSFALLKILSHSAVYPQEPPVLKDLYR